MLSRGMMFSLPNRWAISCNGVLMRDESANVVQFYSYQSAVHAIDMINLRDWTGVYHMRPVPLPHASSDEKPNKYLSTLIREMLRGDTPIREYRDAAVWAADLTGDACKVSDPREFAAILLESCLRLGITPRGK